MNDLLAQQASADASSSSRLRYNALMEDRQARHIGDIIRERNNRGTRGLAAIPNLKPHFISRAQKILHLILAGVLNALATIGWFVTLPFITHDAPAVTAREQSRG